MSPTIEAAPAATNPNTDITALKSRLKTTWMTGDYDQFSRFMEADSKLFLDRLDLRPGSRFLDVACGSGQLALLAARAGVQATGCDIATNWIVKARSRAAREGLPATFEEGDAEALPYSDRQFDTVATIFGAMFAPRPELAAAELLRVCRPGGTIAMANWTPTGFIGRMFKVIAKHIAPPGMPSPVLWGDDRTVRERFADGVTNLRMERRMFRFRYPFPPAGVVEFFRATYGPMARAFAALDSTAQAHLHQELVELWFSGNQAVESGTQVDAEYLEVIATRR